MTQLELGLAYLAAGMAVAVVLTLARKVSIVDAVLVVGLWPVWAPFVLSRIPMPDGADRIQAATARLAELDALLAERGAYRTAPAPQGGRAGEIALLRHRTLERMHAVRARYRAELGDIQELVALTRVTPDLEVERELAARVAGLAEIELVEPGAPREYTLAARR